MHEDPVCWDEKSRNTEIEVLRQVSFATRDAGTRAV